MYIIRRYDTDRSNFIDFMELKLMMEKLGEPQTHLGLKEMIKAVDEDNDGQISFREVNIYNIVLSWYGVILPKKSMQTYFHNPFLYYYKPILENGTNIDCGSSISMVLDF